MDTTVRLRIGTLDLDVRLVLEAEINELEVRFN
jgi:hypothetical protein